MIRKFALWGLIAAALFALPTMATAQGDASHVAPTEGVVLPSPSITETRDATSLSTNPANMGYLDSWSLVYVGSWLKNQEHVAGHGHGFFVGLPLGRILSIGLAAEFLTPSTEIQAWQQLDRRVRASMGLAMNFNRAIAIGAAYRTFWAYDYGELRTFDVGLTVQPSNYMAMSFVASDVSAPDVSYQYYGARDSREAARGFNVGLTIRPFGNDRMALGGELNYLYADQFTRTDLTGLLSIMLVEGLTIRGRFGAEGIGDSSQSSAGGEPLETGYFVDGALEIDLPNFGLGMSMHGQVKPSELASYHGTTWSARFSGDDGPSLNLPRPIRHARAAEIKIEKPIDSYGLARLVSLVERIQRDDGVDMVVFRPSPGTISLSYAQEIRRLIENLEGAGKSSICYLESATGSVYLACAAADKIWINPAGGVRLAGLATTGVFFRGLFDKLGVKADFVRIGEYKSAPEAFTRKTPTRPADFQINTYMDSAYTNILQHLAADRGYADMEAARITVEQGPFTAREALGSGLVDKLVPRDTIKDELKELASGPVFLDQKYGESPLRHRRYLDDPSVAVLHISGSIVDGESVDIPFLQIRTAGSDTIVEAIHALKKDNRIKAVVLRIDSPGGSALASEIIWREIMALRREKPVIATMGSVAASGGYYIASAADEIFAEATTLTGSIGIFYGKAHIDGLLAKVGVNTKTYKRGLHADVNSVTRPYTSGERRHLMSQIQETYDLFRQRVVEGRGRGFTPEIVDKLGQGRVWSGTDAKYHLLVDDIGGYEDALNRAREIARVPEDTKTFHFPKPSGGLLSRLVSSVVYSLKQPSPLEQLFMTPSFKRTLKHIIPFAMVDSDAPRAALPFVLYEE